MVHSGTAGWVVWQVVQACPQTHSVGLWLTGQGDFQGLVYSGASGMQAGSFVKSPDGVGLQAC